MAPALPPNDNRGPLILGVVWTFVALDIIIVALRFYNRVHLGGGLGWDDWTILAACATTTFGGICIIIMVANNWGRHIEYLSPQQRSTALEWVTFAELQSYFAVYLVKISVCLFILRLLSKTHRRMRWAIYTQMAILTVVTFVAVIFLCVSCIPFEGIWNLDPSFHKKCLSPGVQTSVTRAFGIIGVLTDFVCVIIPIWIIQQLQMSRRDKIAVSLIIGLGLFTAACSIGKTVTSVFTSNDASWDYTSVLIWAGLEANLGIIVASMPALRQLFGNVLQSSSTRKPRSGGTSALSLGHIQNYSKSSKSNNRTQLGSFAEIYDDEDVLVHEQQGIVQTRSFTIES